LASLIKLDNAREIMIGRESPFTGQQLLIMWHFYMLLIGGPSNKRAKIHKATAARAFVVQTCLKVSRACSDF
jgi:hypothetical protein